MTSDSGGWRGGTREELLAALERAQARIAELESILTTVADLMEQDGLRQSFVLSEMRRILARLPTRETDPDRMQHIHIATDVASESN